MRARAYRGRCKPRAVRPWRPIRLVCRCSPRNLHGHRNTRARARARFFLIALSCRLNLGQSQSENRTGWPGSFLSFSVRFISRPKVKRSTRFMLCFGRTMNILRLLLGITQPPDSDAAVAIARRLAPRSNTSRILPRRSLRPRPWRRVGSVRIPNSRVRRGLPPRTSGRSCFGSLEACAPKSSG